MLAATFVDVVGSCVPSAGAVAVQQRQARQPLQFSSGRHRSRGSPAVAGTVTVTVRSNSNRHRVNPCPRAVTTQSAEREGFEPSVAL